MPDEPGVTSQPIEFDDDAFDQDQASEPGIPIEQPDGVEPPPEEESSLTVPLEFDSRHRSDFDGLLYLGAITHEFDWAGHSFVIKTPTVGEMLQVGLLSAEYANTIGESRAYTSAIAAAVIVSVDGKRLPSAIGRDGEKTLVADRFRYINDNWYPWTVDAVYARYAVLEARVAEVIRKMGEA